MHCVSTVREKWGMMRMDNVETQYVETRLIASLRCGEIGKWELNNGKRNG